MKPSLLEFFPYGKYRGLRFRDLASRQQGYFKWFREAIKDKDTDLAYTLAYWLGEAISL